MYNHTHIKQSVLHLGQILMMVCHIWNNSIQNSVHHLVLNIILGLSPKG
jgi:hypothetical protein